MTNSVRQNGLNTPSRRERPIPLGEFAIAANGEALVTKTGMAVFVAVRDPVLGIGGGASVLLPADEARHDVPATLSMRLGNLEMEHLLTALHKRGVPRARLEFFVFGAAADGHGRTVAAANAALVRSFLEIEGLRLVHEDLGGTFARDIAFTPASGERRADRCDAGQTGEVFAAERRFLDLQHNRAARDDITLF
jgi:chemotaxis protein CheD